MNPNGNWFKKLDHQMKKGNGIYVGNSNDEGLSGPSGSKLTDYDLSTSNVLLNRDVHVK